LTLKYFIWFSLKLLAATFLILRRTERDIIINVRRCSCKVFVIFFVYTWNLNFLYRLLKNPQTSNLIKIRLGGAELFHAVSRTDGRTDSHDEANTTGSRCFECTKKRRFFNCTALLSRIV
jgi:hypothetical protein